MNYAKVVSTYHVLITSILIIVLFSLSDLSILSFDSLLQFDALHYQTIALSGYSGTEQAFFPMFPILWRMIGVDPLYALILNGSIYLVLLVIASKHFHLGLGSLLLICCLPSSVFYFAPYSESIFALCAMVLLIGMSTKRKILVAIGILLCSITRPTVIILIPSLLLSYWLVTKSPIHLIRWNILIAASGLAGIGMVMFIQYMDTGELFGFYHAQETWGNSVSIPRIPFTSWGGGPIVMLDSVAFLVGVACGVSLIHEIHTRLRSQISSTPLVLILSKAYACSISILILVIHDGELYSLNRFIFCTPFFWIILHHHFNKYRSYSFKSYLIVTASIVIYFVLFGSYVHIQTFSRFLALALFLSAGYFFYDSGLAQKRIINSVFILIMILVQTYYSFRFLSGEWVG